MGLSTVDLVPATILGRNRERIEGRPTATSRREACAQGAVLILASYNAFFLVYILFNARFWKQYAPRSSCAAVQARTDCVGSNYSTSGGFDHHKSGGLGDQVSWLGVTWDAERVVGISFTFFNDPEKREEGEYNPHRYAHAEIHFARGEMLGDLVLKASGYRHRMHSLRRIELSTSKDQLFIAGPDGIADVVVVAGTDGTVLSGFYGLVNKKNCLQALGAWIAIVPDELTNVYQIHWILVVVVGIYREYSSGAIVLASIQLSHWQCKKEIGESHCIPSFIVPSSLEVSCNSYFKSNKQIAMTIYEPLREAKTVLVRLKYVARAEVTYHVPDEKRLPRPRPNLEALPKLEAAKQSIGSQEWWDAWFEYLSKDKKDRDNIRDLILSKLPAKTLFRVGWVPSYRETMLNYSKNPLMQRHLRHKKNQYFLTTFCVKEKEIKEETEEAKAKKLREAEEAKAVVEGENVVKRKDSARKSVKPDAKSGEQEVVIEETPETDSYLEGVDLEDTWVQLELTQGEQYVKLRGLQIRGENDTYQKLEQNPYVEVEGWETKEEDMGFGTAYLGYNVVSLKELLRKVQGYDPLKKKWITMPSLNFLPPKVNGMLAGEGGLLLLSGDIRPYVDPNAPKIEEKPKEGDGDARDEKKKSIKPGDEPRKSSLKSGDDKKKASVTLEEPPAEEREGGDEGAKQDASDETKKIKKKKEKPAKKVAEPYKPPEFPPQHLLVVVNPITRAFRALPPMHVNLENLVARLIVHSTSGSYTAYVVGFHRRIKECVEFEGMRVAVYKSCEQQWSIHVVPSCRVFLPGQCTYSRALPLLTNLCEGPTLFMSGQIVTNVAGVHTPVVLAYRLRTRTWKSYHWPPLSVTEAPHVLEVHDELYIVARGAAEPATINIWKFTQHVYEVPDCQQVAMMPQEMFSKCFCTGFRKAAFDCVSSMGCIAIVSREVATLICLYDVAADTWREPMQRYPGFVQDQTFLGNWSYEPTPYAVV